VQVYAPGSNAVGVGWCFLIFIGTLRWGACGCGAVCFKWRCVYGFGALLGNACGVVGFPISHRPRSYRWVQGHAYAVRRPVFGARYV